MDVEDLQRFGICVLDVVHPLSFEEIATRRHSEAKSASLASYIENAWNTEGVLGLNKEVLESRNITETVQGRGGRFLSPGILALWKAFPEQAPPGEHRQHNENALATGTPGKIKSVLWAGSPLSPYVVMFVTALELENKCIRTSWCVSTVMDGKDESTDHLPIM